MRFPVDFLVQIVQPKAWAATVAEKRWLDPPLARFGQLEPGLVIVQGQRVYLKEGHHRLFECFRINRTWMDCAVLMT